MEWMDGFGVDGMRWDGIGRHDWGGVKWSRVEGEGVWVLWMWMWV